MKKQHVEMNCTVLLLLLLTYGSMSGMLTLCRMISLDLTKVPETTKPLEFCREINKNKSLGDYINFPLV